MAAGVWAAVCHDVRWPADVKGRVTRPDFQPSRFENAGLIEVVLTATGCFGARWR